MFLYGAWSMVSQLMACLLLVIENWLYRAEQFRGLSVLAEDHSSVLSIHVGQLMLHALLWPLRVSHTYA